MAVTKNRTPLLAAIVVIAALVAVLDFWTSAELIGSVPLYVPTRAVRRLRLEAVTLEHRGAVVVVLTIAAEFWGVNRPELANPLDSTVNRGLLIASLLTLATFIHLRIAREKTLRDSEERFRLLVESVSDYAIFMLDPKGIVTNWNIGAERIKGYKADEIVGQHFSRFYAEDDVHAGKCERELENAARVGRFED